MHSKSQTTQETEHLIGESVAHINARNNANFSGTPLST
jgi:hypothetical protein